MNWKKPGAKVILGLFALCLAIDIFTVVGQEVAPDAVGRTMCTLWPFAMVGRLLFPTEWSRYVEGACTAFPNYAPVSVMAFLLKVSLVSLGLVAAIAIMAVAITPGQKEPEALPEEASSSPSNETSQTGTPVSDWGLVFFVFILPAIISWRLIAHKSPDDFHGSIAWKALEDMFLFAYFGAGILAWIALVDIVLLPTLRRCFPGQHWIGDR